MSTQIELVEEAGAFADLLERLRAEPVVGLDTEAASFHRYHDRVYLLQLSSPTHTAVVDPLAMGGLPGLDRLLADARVELVLHDADYDVRLLYHQFAYRLRRLFDTRIAAQLVNAPGVGLAALLEQRFGVITDKRLQRANWSTRPLTPAMIAYAANDTRFLPALRESLREDLVRLERLHWFEEECALIARVEWSPPEPPETAFLRLKGARTLDRRSLGILRELFVLRERLAARLDRALFRILGNEPLLELARERPRSLSRIAGIRGVGRDLVHRHGNDLLAAIERGLGIPESELPRFEHRPRPAPDPAFEVRLDRLRAVRSSLAAHYDLPPGVLCPNGTLEAIARAVPATLTELECLPGVRRWQCAEFGTVLLEAVRLG